MSPNQVQYEKPRRRANVPGLELVNMSDQPSGDSTRVKICSVEGCDRRSNIRGMCKMHYERNRRRLKAPDRNYYGQRFIGVGRFDSKVKESTENFYNGTPCWEWQAYRSNGYGFYSVYRTEGSKNPPAHRYAYETLVGPIPAGLHIDHLCRNKCCVNPAHLEPVTQGENNYRNPEWNGHITHCKSGHPFDEANTAYSLSHGYWYRRCRACHREYGRRQREKRQQLRGELSAYRAMAIVPSKGAQK